MMCDRAPFSWTRNLKASALLILLAAVICIAPVLFAAESEEGLIEKTYDEWVQVTNTKDIDRWWTFVAPGAVFTPPGEPVLRTEEAIRGFYEKSFADPNFSLDCKQLSVEIAESGDMAWARGSCKATFTDPNGQAASGNSRWFKIWLKQTDGSWKCKVNIWNVGGS